MTITTDQAAELRRAISETRIVFESEPTAGEALNYLEAVLAAGAPVPAQTGIAGGGPSTTEETLAIAGAEPVVLENSATDQAGAEAPVTIIAKLAVDIDTSTITVALTMIEQLAQAVSGLAELDGLCASITDSLSATGSTAADQAAATMAAESAQLVIDAEKSAAGAAARAAVDPLAVLSREVFSLSNKLQQPADLVVQLMVLAELRGQRADHARSSAPLTVVLS